MNNLFIENYYLAGTVQFGTYPVLLLNDILQKLLPFSNTKTLALEGIAATISEL